MKKNGEVGIPIGTSLLLMVFVLICLVTFAALAFISSSNDNEMSILNAESNTEYYEAEVKAQEELRKIDQLLAETSTSQGLSDLKANENYSVETIEGKNYLSFEIKVNDKESLEVTIEIKNPGQGQGYYNIEGWKLIYTGDWQEDDSIKVLIN